MTRQLSIIVTVSLEIVNCLRNKQQDSDSIIRHIGNFFVNLKGESSLLYT